MTHPESIKGQRLVGALAYYKCSACEEPRGPLLITGFEQCCHYWGQLLTADGALFFFREWDGIAEGALIADKCIGHTVPEHCTPTMAIRLVREIGRIACPDGVRADKGDHVFFDWRFEPVS